MDKSKVIDYIDVIKDDINKMAIDIWDNAEVSNEEVKSSQLYKETLKSHGFRITEYDGELKNAFIAEYGSGKPVIAVLAEYDALPGLSQNVDTEFNPIKENAPGHGCGHNLLGAASFGSVLAIKKYIEEENIEGTIRFYGSPEEETLVGKGKMLKAGMFEGCDLALSWHPMNVNATLKKAFLSNNSIKFKFHGISSHAAQSPESGRSALDAVELMNVGANYLREHVIDSARIHYTITNAGGAPNIIPSEAESWYFVRAPHRKDVEEITERLIKVSQGAAMMTETTTDYEILGGSYEYLPNNILTDLTYKNMKEIDTPEYTKEELQFAKSIQETVDPKTVKAEIKKFIDLGNSKEETYIHQEVIDEKDADSVVTVGSSDSGDVSWNMPMNVFLTATWPQGVAAHSWQATASSGSSMGLKGMLYSSKILTATMYDLLNDNKLVEEAIKEFNERTQEDKYVSAIV